MEILLYNHMERLLCEKLAEYNYNSPRHIQERASWDSGVYVDVDLDTTLDYTKVWDLICLALRTY